ncbi:DEAD-box ATP-dependent RNA helicase 50 [Trifolium pratense]|uniref:DEAD-box ATP-dependent RNA helicase 50 n=1 Tax=Trifolium pratense TaxID=57577 RepID=UPI001E69513D|nr:DEAD-box ATP-dependent RNA helicase 50 [Trifolium pratense]
MVLVGVCGKAVLFSIGVRVRPKTTTHSLFIVSNSTTSADSQDTTTTTSFGRLKVQKVKALIHRTKQNTRRERVLVEEEDDRSTSQRQRRSPPPPPGWGDNKVTQTQSLPEADTNFFSLKSFKDIGCADFMIQSLHKLSLTRPSNIQAMSFPPIIARKSCIIADQSGSGKTLAYLLPIIQHLRQQELLLQSPHHNSQSPTVLILAPTSELASQVLDNCRSLSKSGVPFKSMVVTGGYRQKAQLDSLKQGVDVLIATPGRFLFLIKEGFLHLTNLTCAVLDEVDILFGDEDFEKALQYLISSSPVDTQYLFVTATLPKNVYSKLVEVFPDCEMVMGPSMHRISSRLEEIIVDCSGEDGQEKTLDTAFLNKKAALLKLAEKNRVPRTIVFCNKIETCRKVENALKRFDRKGIRIQVLPFHAAMTQESRLASMKEFTRSPSKEVSQFMVCTDRASRGIDFTRVDHVILFDYPRDPSEYVRRVGRTARGARGQGKAFIFVVGKQVSLASKVMERNRKGHPLHDVPSAYEY